MDDLIEQKGKEYYLGQLLFEVDGDILFIIDGQQRLTTSVILFSALSCRLKECNVDITEFESLYLTDKFKTIEEDQILFKKCTRRHITSGATTISQKRILAAYSYFYNNLPNTKEILLDIKKSLEEALITTFFIRDKIKATQVFEYQNNRGKDLSPFEVIKAYLMHQIYLNADNKNSANSVISDIQAIISKIYRNMEATESYFTEVELLNIFCDLYYSIRGNITEVKEKLTKITNKIEWIISFFEGFEEITDNARLVILSKNDKNISNLFFVGNEADWKIILISIFYKGENDKSDFKIILKTLEILCFKLKLGDFRTDYLPGYAKSYFRNEINFNELLEKIKISANSGFKYYWNDGNKFENIIVNYFENQNYHYHQIIIKYVLWQYENAIRVENKSGALLDKELYDEYTIEHIAPQTPSKDKYTEDFEKNYLHKAGNLSLLTKSQNSKFNNKPFEDKKSLFEDTALSSYTEIRKNNTWGEPEISSRHSNIVSFIKKHFEIPVL
jgi:uncharacterized protein with ParB-like and HNH nuclease domain